MQVDASDDHLKFTNFRHVHKIHPFDNYVTTTLFSTSDHLNWKGFQVLFSWAMHGEAKHPSSTHVRKKF